MMKSKCFVKMIKYLEYGTCGVKECRVFPNAVQSSSFLIAWFCLLVSWQLSGNKLQENNIKQRVKTK